MMYIEKIHELNLNMKDINKLVEISKYHQKFLAPAIAKRLKPRKVALIKSIISTNAIEGIHTKVKTDTEELINGTRKPETREEYEVMGSIKLHNAINDNFWDINISKQNICNLHKILTEVVSPRYAGKIIGNKNITKLIGNEETIIHKGSSSILVHEHIDQLCENYNQLAADKDTNKLLLSIIFVSELLAIHPFNDGNGRLSRALFSLLCLRSGFNVSLYKSIDALIHLNSKTYYEALQQRSDDWNKEVYDINSNSKFVSFMIDVLWRAYNEANDEVGEIVKPVKMKIANTVYQIIDSIDGEFTRSDVLERLPYKVSSEYVSEILKHLVADKKLEKTGTGKGTKYKKILP